MALVSAAAVLLVLLSTPGPDPGPLPVDDLTRFERALTQQVELEVGRDRARLVAGRATTYTIVVQNRGEQPEPVTVRVSVPPGLAEVDPDPAGVLGSGFVDWPVTVDPDAPATLRLTGTYARPARSGWDRTPARVTLTACVLDASGEQPLACATDVAELRGRESVYAWWWLAAVAVVAGAIAALAWHRRRRRPSPARKFGEVAGSGSG